MYNTMVKSITKNEVREEIVEDTSLSGQVDVIIPSGTSALGIINILREYNLVDDSDSLLSSLSL